MDANETGNILLTKQEVAKRLRVHPKTIDRYCDKGYLEYIRVGPFRRFRPEAVEAYLKGRTFKHRQGI